jgi:hypothetical protein
MIRTSFLKAAAAAALSLAALAGTSTAAQAQHTINFEGAANVRDETPGGGGDFLLVDFLTHDVTGYGAPGTVTTVARTDLPGVGAGRTGLLMDLRASSAGFTGLPMASFFTVGDYTFALTGTDLGNAAGFGPISLFEAGPHTFATFNVSGTVTGGAYGAAGRAYNGAFSTQFLNVTPAQLFNRVNAGGTPDASFSATLAVAPANVVPEPSTYALLATGIGALGLVARRRARA